MHVSGLRFSNQRDLLYQKSKSKNMTSRPLPLAQVITRKGNIADRYFVGEKPRASIFEEKSHLQGSGVFKCSTSSFWSGSVSWNLFHFTSSGVLFFDGLEVSGIHSVEVLRVDTGCLSKFGNCGSVYLQFFRRPRSFASFSHLHFPCVGLPALCANPNPNPNPFLEDDLQNCFVLTSSSSVFLVTLVLVNKDHRTTMAFGHFSALFLRLKLQSPRSRRIFSDKYAISESETK